MGEGVTQGVSHYQFGGRRGPIGGAQPTPKEAPDGVMMVKSQVLEQTLNNEPDLNVAFVSSDLASDLSSVDFALAMEILVTVTSTNGSHVSHPEVIGIRADGVDSRLETDLNLETPPIKANDRHGVQSGVGT